MTGQPLDYEGEFYQFQKAWIKPKIDPPLPIMVGGRSNAALARAVKFSDGWLASWCSLRRYTEAVEIMGGLSRHRLEFPARHGLQLWAGFDEDKNQARKLLASSMEHLYQVPFEKFERYTPFGSPQSVAEYLIPFREAGCRIFNIMPVASAEQAGIEAVAEVKRLLSGRDLTLEGRGA